MGNIYSDSYHILNPPPSPAASRASYSSAASQQSGQARLRQLCSLSTFLLGGPMPPTPGLIPLCWEELSDWADDATELAEVVDRHNTAISALCGSSGPATVAVKQGIRFIPYVSILEKEDALRRLASQTYVKRAQFYQESVLVAVEDIETGELVCVISPFQFCRYYTLLRRLADSQTLVLEYPPSGEVATTVMKSSDDWVMEREGTCIDHPLASRMGVEEMSLTLPPGTQDAPIQGAGLDECVICVEKTEDSVLMCCSHALCSDCEKRWVRKRLRCPFCRQSFSSVKEAVQTQWQLSIAAIPLEQVLEDVRCLETKIKEFWKKLLQTSDPALYASVLTENYVQRPKTLQSCSAEEGEGDGFVVIEELSLSCAVAS